MGVGRDADQGTTDAGSRYRLNQTTQSLARSRALTGSADACVPGSELLLELVDQATSSQLRTGRVRIFFDGADHASALRPLHGV